MTTVVIQAGSSGGDDSARINAALADPDVTTVVLGAGTFYASASIIVPSGTTLMGQGADGTMIRALPDFVRDAGSFGVVASETGAVGVSVSDLSIDANKLLVDGARLNGCYMDQATGFTISSVNTYNATGYGHFAQGDLNAFVRGDPNPIYASGTYNDCWSFNSNVGFEQMFCDGITLTNVHVRDGDGDINTEYSFHPLSGSKNITYVGATAIGAKGGFGLVTTIAPLENISIIDSRVEVGTSPAITSDGFNPVIGLEITNSSFISASNAGARIGGVSGTFRNSYFQGAVIGAEFGYSSDGSICEILIVDTYSIGISKPTSLAAAYGVNVFGDGINWQGGRIEAWGPQGLMYPVSGSPRMDRATQLVANGYYGPPRNASGWILADFVLGKDTDDRLTGGAGNDVLVGLAGNDILNSGGGRDVMQGGLGDDRYYVDDPSDVTFEAADEGFDIVYTSTNFALVAGSHIEVLGTIDWRLTDPLRLTGNELNNKLIGNSGANQLYGGAGDDTLMGMEGDDILDGGPGRDLMIGGAGNDSYYVDNPFDVVREAANEGFDTVYTSVNFTLERGSHVEVIGTIDWRLTDPLKLVGNELNNKLIGNSGANQLYGGDGNDSLVGLDGDDILDGGAGADIMEGGRGDDTYFVTQGDRIIERAGEGFDSVYASESFTLGADWSIELLATINPYATDAIDLTGNNLNNAIIGNAGNNRIDGGAGSDTLRGLGGADSFVFSTALGPDNIDLLPDFEPGIDKILLVRSIFSNLAMGALEPGAFVTGAAAMDSNDRIIFDRSTGALFYDADGNGAGAAVQFATLNPGLNLSAADFMII